MRTHAWACIPYYILKTLRDDRRPPKAFGVDGTKKGAGDARRFGFWKVFGRFSDAFFILGGEALQRTEQLN